MKTKTDMKGSDDVRVETMNRWWWWCTEYSLPENGSVTPYA